ncbi:MAG: hypothetical protein EOO91_10320 [Pedobacter sp.]|nr:MAG: hypothetical protein EOO91_10320 [Pedobacter sp.]
MNPIVKYLAVAILLVAVVGISIKRTISQSTALPKRGCFVHHIRIDTTQKSILFPKLAGHLLSYTRDGKALLTTITYNFTRPIPMKEWLALKQKPNKSIAIQSTLIETRGTVKANVDTLFFKSNKTGFFDKVFLMERVKGSIIKLKDLKTNDDYVIGTCDPNL